MSIDQITTAKILSEIVAANWPIVLGVAFIVLACGGIVSVYLTARAVHGGEDDNVVNFERWRG